MFNKEEVVIHKKYGALVVDNIITEDFGVGPKEYYVLVPKYVNKTNASLILHLQVENAENYIRKPISKEMVDQLIKSIPTMEKIWFKEARTRKQKFEEMYANGSPKDFCQLVKMLYVEDEFFQKPMSLTDRNFLYKVRDILFDEFAVVLDITPDNVEKYIQNNSGL